LNKTEDWKYNKTFLSLPVTTKRFETVSGLRNRKTWVGLPGRSVERIPASFWTPAKRETVRVRRWLFQMSFRDFMETEYVSTVFLLCHNCNWYCSDFLFCRSQLLSSSRHI